VTRVGTDDRVGRATRPSAEQSEAVLLSKPGSRVPNFTKLTTQSELPPADKAKEFACGDKTICVANVNGEFTAMDNVCLHRGGPLGQGMIAGNKVVCPWHGWEWNVKTGEATQNPSMKVAVYPLKIENGDLMIEI